jgi:hypothetical protein
MSYLPTGKLPNLVKYALQRVVELPAGKEMIIIMRIFPEISRVNLNILSFFHIAHQMTIVVLCIHV